MTTLTMSVHSTPRKRKRKPTTWSSISDLFSRMLLVVIFTAAAAGAFVLLFSRRTALHPLLFKAISIAAIGLAAGFSARWLLRGSVPLLRLMTALGTLLAILAVLGIWSQGFMGIALLRANTSAPDWHSLWQLALGGAAVCLPLFAWSGMRIRRSTRRRASRPPKSRRSGCTRAWKTALRNTAAFVHELQSPFTQLSAFVQRVFRSAPAPAARRSSSPAPARVPAPPSPLRRNSTPLAPTPPQAALRIRSAVQKPLSVQPARQRHHKNATVQLLGMEEHRCPYCLDLVLPDDPRGDVVCAICGAHHHQDCWDITGACQVPHNHE
ncbi:MAG: hypothetical protein HPY45_14245 [Anaerolineae bacterium]|nr:hypothetical protein [Anaerolineae bacterium]